MKEFNNYMEQVKYSVAQMVAFNNYPNVSENYYENDLQAGTLQSLEDGNVYQWYAVEIIGNEDEETERLGIFWDEDLEIYIMPVTHFGT
ncbi:hypothetical protein EFT43_07730 [Leuconostoc falkenbergense]|uniref:hypothetical protein n=1 Tax=Leuconostoc falkenbergense TaxID=2766470 RepID=UPI0021A9AB58|nr:hypothetical protein [Leuconostoc falkenbergense]MCT4404786.1 hypothetical protein [Leuconostoc falkenbergense]